MKISTSMWKSEHILSSRVLHVIHICYSSAGRSVLGETVHEVLSTARDRRPRAVLRPRAHFLPVRTDLDRWRIFLFFSYGDLKVSGKFYFSLQPMYVEEGRVGVDVQNARSIANQNITTWFLNFIYIITIKLSFRIKKGFCVLVDNS